MVKYILFLDTLRKEEIDMFYDACQMQRDYYRGYPKAYHPLKMFKDPEYEFQCPPEMSSTYLSFPPYHVKYKQPTVLPPTYGRTSSFPPLPGRTLAGRYNVNACKACQSQRDYYRGYPKAYHPLTYFRDAEYEFQCPPEMSKVYLSFPAYHVKYKQPVTLAPCYGRTSNIPAMPDRTLAGRYNKAACQAFVR